MGLSESLTVKRRGAFPDRFSLCVLCVLCGKKSLPRFMAGFVERISFIFITPRACPRRLANKTA